MSFLRVSERSRVIEYLQGLVSQAIIDLGIRFASAGYVTECSKSGSFINGVVRNESGASATTQLEIISTRELIPRCNCRQGEADGESWCEHAVALFLRSCDLAFFSSNSGFADTQSTWRPSGASAQDVALVIKELAQARPVVSGDAPHWPEVLILLDITGDRLGLQVLFDGVIQEPALFEDFRPLSPRALDNLLLEILDEEGAWDEEERRWYVNSSRGISMVVGLLGEFKSVRSLHTREPVVCRPEIIDAVLMIDWQTAGAELTMEWLLPDGQRRQKESELIGNGPYWVAIENRIFRVSAAGARVASVFRGVGNLVISGAKVGLLLESLASEEFKSAFVEIRHRELQPESEVKSPQPVLEVGRSDVPYDHFASSQTIELEATLDFEYPKPPARERVVYLPDRAMEKECYDFLVAHGFEYRADRKKFSITSNTALDLISGEMKPFPPNWKVIGLDQIKKSVRISDLKVAVSLAAVGEAGEKTTGRRAAERPDWFDCHISLVLNNANVPISTLFKGNWSDDTKWLRLENGSYAKVPGGTLSQFKTSLGMLDSNFRLSNNIRTRLSTAQAVGVSRISDERFFITLDQPLRELSRKLENFDGIKRAKISRNFNGKLRPYQEEGLSWLSFLHDFKFSGILADEMGLGKTVQALALFQNLKDKQGKTAKNHKPSLVIAPTSVIMNWWYEAKKFTPKLNVLILHGPARRNKFKLIPEQDIVITSYALLRIDRAELEQHRFNYVLLDEAQVIKNYQAATTIAAKSLIADHRLALSGTPTENRPMELWSILDFLMPGYLGSYEFFRTQVERPILEIGPQVPVAGFLKRRTKPFIMRRCKADVEKDLPPKIETVLHVAMTDPQRDLYLSVLHEVRPKVLRAVKERGVSGASVSILAALLRLRQVCNHPNSIEAFKNLSGYDSGKFNLLKDLLEEALANGRKILLFGQFLEMLSIIRDHLDEQGVNYLYLDGATRDRQTLVDRFNQDESVRLFLISLKAGGLGVNLAAADMVVIYDPWWNPAVENQAVDRAHRIGQKRKVSVYRLVTEDSVEQRIMALKRKKAALVDALINENGLTTLSLTKIDIESLFADPEGGLA